MRDNRGGMHDPCEWNPQERRAAYEDEVHASAEISLGNGAWRLCATCAVLPEFKRYRKRMAIKREER